MRKTKFAKNRRRISHNRGALKKTVLDGNLTREEKKFLDSNGIKPEGATPLGRMEILLFTEDENGDIVSYFDDTQLAINRANTTPINKDELWVCIVETGADNIDYAQPLYEITTEQILEMDGKIETFSKFVWKNNPDEVVEHLGVSEDILKLDEFESKFEKLRKESDELRSEIEKRENFDKDSIRAEIEDEFKETVKKLKNEHKLVLMKLAEEYGEEEKKTKKEIDGLNKKIKKLEKRDDEEVQRLNKIISELEKENENLESEIDTYKTEKDQKIEELTNENLTGSSYYEGIIEGLNERLRTFESETTNLEDINKALIEDLEESRKETNEKIEELTTVRTTLSEYYEDESRKLKGELEKYKRESELLRNRPTSSEESHDLQILLESKTREVAMLTRNVEDLDRRNRVLTDMLEQANYRDASNGDSVNTIVRQKQNSMSGSVIRISADEFKCSLIDEGSYSVRINADRTIMRFVPDSYGTARCRNGIIYVPDLNMIEVLGNKFGELKWKIVNGNTLEVSI